MTELSIQEKRKSGDGAISGYPVIRPELRFVGERLDLPAIRLTLEAQEVSRLGEFPARGLLDMTSTE